MERAPLRPVPSRPSRPPSEPAAVEAVQRALPQLPPAYAALLGLVALAGRSRAEAARRAGIDEADAPAVLAHGRKALRQTLCRLSGSGWCERAEPAISDRIDGELGEVAAARLDVHLRNCVRCVEHERRLVHATDALVASVDAAAAGPRREPPLLQMVRPGSELPPPREEEADPQIEGETGADVPTPTAEPERRGPEPERPAAPGTPAMGPEPPTAKQEEPEAPPEEPAGPPPGPAVEAEEPAGPPPGPTVEAEEQAEPGPAAKLEAPAAEPEPVAGQPQPVVAVPEPLKEARPARHWSVALAAASWWVLLALAVMLALASVALTVAGVLGAEL